jgi:hypothetical protein
MNWFWKKPKVVEEPKSEPPWWYGLSFIDVIEKKLDVSNLLDEMTTYYEKGNWHKYEGWEPLAMLILVERKRQKDAGKSL